MKGSLALLVAVASISKPQPLSYPTPLTSVTSSLQLKLTVTTTACCADNVDNVFISSGHLLNTSNTYNHCICFFVAIVMTHHRLRPLQEAYLIFELRTWFDFRCLYINNCESPKSQAILATKCISC